MILGCVMLKNFFISVSLLSTLVLIVSCGGGGVNHDIKSTNSIMISFSPNRCTLTNNEMIDFHTTIYPASESGIDLYLNAAWNYGPYSVWFESSVVGSSFDIVMTCNEFAYLFGGAYTATGVIQVYESSVNYGKSNYSSLVISQ